MKRHRPFMTNGAFELLKKMSEVDDELVWSRPGGWWLDLDQVAGQLGMQLLRLVLIRDCGFSGANETINYFVINDEGRKVLSDPNYEPEIIKHMPYAARTLKS